MTFDRIEQNPQIMHGKPVIKGTRIPVSLILNLLAHGQTIEQAIDNYPQLTQEDIFAAIEYASKITNFEEKIIV